MKLFIGVALLALAGCSSTDAAEGASTEASTATVVSAETTQVAGAETAADPVTGFADCFVALRQFVESLVPADAVDFTLDQSAKVKEFAEGKGCGMLYDEDAISARFSTDGEFAEFARGHLGERVAEMFNFYRDGMFQSVTVDFSEIADEL